MWLMNEFSKDLPISCDSFIIFAGFMFFLVSDIIINVIENIINYFSTGFQYGNSVFLQSRSKSMMLFCLFLMLRLLP